MEYICLAGVLITGSLLTLLSWNFAPKTTATKIAGIIACIFWISFYPNIGAGIVSDNWNGWLGLAVAVVGLINIIIIICKRNNKPKSEDKENNEHRKL